MPCDLDMKPPRGLGTAFAITDDDQPPGQIAQPGESGHQHVITLARDHGANREHDHGARTLARARRDAIGSRLHHDDPAGRQAIVRGKQTRGRGTGSDDTVGARERRPFAGGERRGLARA